MEIEKLRKFEKRIPFSGYAIVKTVYYLSNFESGLRIEVTKFTRTFTTEVFLLIGDGKNVQKTIYKQNVIRQATKKEIDQTIREFIQYAESKFHLCI